MNKSQEDNVKKAIANAGKQNLTYKLPRLLKKPVVKNKKQLEAEITAAHADGLEGEYLGWGKDIYDVPHAWDTTKGEGITVAVLDTGVDRDHPDLESAIVDVEDFTGEGGGDVDYDGHGTHCAGIIGARLNGLGLVGVAPECKIISGKVLAEDGGRADWVADGIYWAVDEGADIVSMSLGGSVMSPEIYTAVQYALLLGKVVVCAAGNSGVGDGNTIGYPGKNGGVITVASHDIYGNPSGFSSRGGELDFMAPGSDIWSTYKDGEYAKLSGTSMATPFVAGLAALIMSKDNRAGSDMPPVQNCEDLKNRLLVMAAHPNHHDTHSGYGALLPFRYFR